MKISFTKFIIILLLIVLPLMGFYLGMLYEKTSSPQNWGLRLPLGYPIYKETGNEPLSGTDLPDEKFETAPSEKPELNVLRNKAYGFTIEYPSQYYMTSNGGNGASLIDSTVPQTDAMFDPAIKTYIDVSADDPFIKEMFAAKIGQVILSERQRKNTKIKTMNINGYEAIEYLHQSVPLDQTDSPYMCSRKAAINFNGMYIKFDDWTDPTWVENCKDFYAKKNTAIFNQIISSFKAQEIH